MRRGGRAHVLTPHCWFGLISPNDHLARDTVVRLVLMVFPVYAQIHNSLLDYAFPPRKPSQKTMIALLLVQLLVRTAP